MAITKKNVGPPWWRGSGWPRQIQSVSILNQVRNALVLFCAGSQARLNEPERVNPEEVYFILIVLLRKAVAA